MEPLGGIPELSWYWDNRLTRALDRWRHRLAGHTTCRVFGHRQARYLWGVCGRCYTFYRGAR